MSNQINPTPKSGEKINVLVLPSDKTGVGAEPPLS
jgi:hypothetical protein